MSLLKRLSILLLPVLLAPPSIAAQSGEIWDEPFADARKTRAVVNAMIPMDLEADVEMLLQESFYTFDEAGHSEVRRRRVFRLLTPNAIGMAATVEMEWSPWHQEKPEIRARVVGVDGREHWLDPATLNEAPVHEDQPDIMSDRRVLRAPLPALTPGAIVEEETIVRGRPPIAGAGSVHRMLFGQAFPVRQARLIVDAPTELPLHVFREMISDEGETREEKDGRLRLQIAGGPYERVKRVEPMAPSDVPQWPMVGFSTGSSWQTLAESYHALVEEQLVDANLKKTVKPLVRGVNDRGEKIDRLLAWLQAEIRYTGLEFAEAAIIPRSPEETLSRRYGDCKDKAALLVALLRDAEIPAYLAMLNAGLGPDARPSLPGFGVFNHAIVYVPPAGDEPAVWIDPTDEMARAGELPILDQGRQALVAAPGTKTLTLIPRATHKDNRIEEVREIYLDADLGGGRVVEVTRAWGSADRNHRASFSRLDFDGRQTALENYVQNAFLAEKLTDYTLSDLSDVTQPFELRTESEEARMAYTDMAEAFVVVRPAQLLDRLPRPLLRAAIQDAGGGDSSDDEDGEEDQERQFDLVLPEPYSAEIRYHLVAPPGYRAIDLPDDEERQMGPALFEREVTESKEGREIDLTLRFSTEKSRYTPAEIRELQEAAADLMAEGNLLVRFEHHAEALLAAGEVKKALTEIEELVDLRPENALPHIRRSRALLAAGLGAAARREAERAESLDDERDVVFQNLAWVMQHDAIGRHLQGAFDVQAAVAAYRRAQEIDPENQITRQNLAIALEHNEDGLRYGAGAPLDEALAVYESLLEDFDGSALENNYLIVLMRAGRIEEALEKVEDEMGSSQIRHTVRLAAIAVQESERAAIRAASRISEREQRLDALVQAAQMLARMRYYGQAAALLREGARGQRNASAILGHAETLAKTQRFEELELGDDPEGLVQRLLIAALLNRPEELRDLYSDLTGEKHIEDELEQLAGLGRVLVGSQTGDGAPAEGIVDILLAGLKVSKEGAPEIGYRGRVLWQSGGRNGELPFFVVPEGDGYRLLNLGDLAPLGAAAAAAAEAGNLEAARRWLDWAREATSLPSADDPFAGAPSARFWNRGQQGDAAAVADAALSLMAGGRDAGDVLDDLLERRSQINDEDEARAWDLVLVRTYIVLERHEDVEPLARTWLAERNDSIAAFGFLTWSLSGQERWDDLEVIAQERLERLADDERALRTLANAHLGRGALAEAQNYLRRLVELGKAIAGDYNDLAWHDVMRGTVTEESLDHAQRAVTMSDYNSSGILHTLATVYADLGRGAEAREVLLQAMEVDGYDEPRSDDWYVWGRIAESYGVLDAALDAYQQVEKPGKSWEEVVSSWRVAQRRLAELGEQTVETDSQS